MGEIALRELFNYDSLDGKSCEIVLQKTDETHGLMRRTAENILAIALNLQIVQQQLPEMRFSSWLRAEFAMSRQTACNYMRVAARFSGSCKTVLQLPARVPYTLASASDAILDQIEMGQIPPTIEALRAAKEAGRQARREVQTRQGMIERLNHDLETVRRQLAELSSPKVEMREVEKAVVPPAITAQLDTLQKNVATLTRQRDTLSQQVSKLQEQIRVETSEHPKRERVHLTQAGERIVDGSTGSEADARREQPWTT